MKGNKYSKEGSINTTIHDRIQIVNRASYANSRLLRSKLISHKTKMKIFKTLIRPFLVYGCEMWTIENKEQETLREYERKLV